MPKEPEKKTLQWAILFGITGMIDVMQIIISWTGIGIMVSEAMEAAMPFILLGLLALFRIPIFSNPARLISILGVTIGDSITGGIAPFWFLDVLYLYYSVKKEDSRILAQQAEEDASSDNVRHPLYKDGVCGPDAQATGTLSQPANRNGIRPPNGGLAR